MGAYYEFFSRSIEFSAKVEYAPLKLVKLLGLGGGVRRLRCCLWLCTSSRLVWMWVPPGGPLTDCTWFTILGATGASWLTLAFKSLRRLIRLSSSLRILHIA